MLFDQLMLKIIQENGLDIDIENETSADIYQAVVDTGLNQEQIIRRFEREIGMPFANVLNKEPDYGFIKKYGIARIESLKIFPYIEKDFLHIAIYDPSQIEDLDQMINGSDEYITSFCFDFVIEQKLAEVEELLQAEVETNVGREMVEINENRKSLLLATGQDNIDTVIDSSPMFKADFLVLDKIHRREMLLEKCEELNPDIVLVGENIGGKAPLIPILINIRAACPGTRIIFLLGKVSPGDDALQSNLGILASMGVYDIIADSELSVTRLQYLLKNPQQEADVKNFLDKTKDSSGKRTTQEIQLTVPEEVENEDSVRVYENLYTFVSPVGAVGKSTITRNVAIALNNYATPQLNGKKPKIAIIDLDLQGFGTSRYLDTLNKENSIFTALAAAREAIDELGEMRELTKVQDSEIHEKIKRSFVQTKKYKNLYVLGGDDKVYEKGDIYSINSYLLTFIIESMVSEFDVILVDANTNIEASIIFPLYSMSRTIFNILDISTNCFNMNKRYLTYLEDTGVYQAINNKFILNKAFDMTETYLTLRDVQNALNIQFDYTIPMIPAQTMFNMTSRNEILVDSADDAAADFKASIFDLANSILPLRNFEELLISSGGKITRLKKKRVEEPTKEKTDSKPGFLSKFIKKKE